MKTLEKTQTVNAQMIQGMNELLADLQIFYQNLRGLHWNVKGSLFFVLHAKFEEYYNQTAQTVDEVAERMLMVGGKPIHAFSDYLQVAELTEVTNVSDGKEAVEVVINQSNVLLKKMKNLLEIATQNDDEGTITLFSDLIGETEKRIWMLKTFLNE